jgi:hypothetical protein
MTKVRTWSVSSSFQLVESTGMSVALHQCAAIFKLIVPLLNLCDAHSIVAKNPLNIQNGFHLAIAKLLAKFDAIQLLESCRHFCGK